MPLFSSSNSNQKSTARLLSDEDKQKIVKGLTQKRSDLISTLNKIPFTNQTIGMRENKAKIEAEIDEVENGIRMF
jgi:hypothetical protein